MSAAWHSRPFGYTCAPRVPATLRQRNSCPAVKLACGMQPRVRRENVGICCDRRQEHMALDRWDPLREMMTLREAMDRLFQESVVRPTGSFLAGARGATPVDIAERDNSFVVQAAMPGIAPEDIQVTVKGNTLTIRGEHKDEEERSDQYWLVRERRGQSFYRSVTLPTAVNADKDEAKYENSWLHLDMPKRHDARPKPNPISDQAPGEGRQAPILTP